MVNFLSESCSLMPYSFIYALKRTTRRVLARFSGYEVNSARALFGDSTLTNQKAAFFLKAELDKEVPLCVFKIRACGGLENSRSCVYVGLEVHF